MMDVFLAGTKGFGNNVGLAAWTMEIFLKGLITTFLFGWSSFTLAQRRFPCENTMTRSLTLSLISVDM